MGLIRLIIMNAPQAMQREVIVVIVISVLKRPPRLTLVTHECTSSRTQEVLGVVLLSTVPMVLLSTVPMALGYPLRRQSHPRALSSCCQTLRSRSDRHRGALRGRESRHKQSGVRLSASCSGCFGACGVLRCVKDFENTRASVSSVLLCSGPTEERHEDKHHRIVASEAHHVKVMQ
jgi:hypothetical protein